MKMFKIENGAVYSADMESVRESAGQCYYCNKPVYTSHGQLVKYLGGKPTHKSCRKQ